MLVFYIPANRKPIKIKIEIGTPNFANPLEIAMLLSAADKRAVNKLVIHCF